MLGVLGSLAFQLPGWGEGEVDFIFVIPEVVELTEYVLA